MKKQIIKIAALSISLLFSNQSIAKSKAEISHQEMVSILTEAKEAKIDSVDFKTMAEAKHKKYKENPNEPFSWWEEKIFKDLARNYKILFTRDIVPNIDAVINSSKSTPTQKVASLLNIESEYKEKAAIVVWNNLISKRPDSKNARSAFCKVASETASVKGSLHREKRGEICDKDFQLDPSKHFNWDVNNTPEVIKSIIIAPKLK